MPRVKVANILIETHWVEVPELCPRCSSNLRNEDAVKMTMGEIGQLQGQLVPASFNGTAGDEIGFASYGQSSRESIIEGLDYTCSNCKLCLAEGVWKTLDDPPQPVRTVVMTYLEMQPWADRKVLSVLDDFLEGHKEVFEKLDEYMRNFANVGP